MMRAVKITAILCIVLSLYSCRQQQPEIPGTVNKPLVIEQTYTRQGNVQEMNITPVAVNFPDYEGKAEFSSYCQVCHSLKFISNQPNFPEKVWSEEVHKMIEKFGAPIDSVTSAKIVKYLTHIKGERQVEAGHKPGR